MPKESATCPTCQRDDFESAAAMKIHHKKTHDVSLAGVGVDCHWCGERVRRRKNRVENAERIFCDASCRGSWRSENWTAEDFPRWKGGLQTVACHQCGNTFDRRRDQVEEYERSFCGRDCFGTWRSNYQRGENNPAWTGGREIRTTVRDLIGDEPWDRTADRVREQSCETCGKEQTSDGRRLSVHHIVPIMAGGCNDPELLMTLCMTCHRRVEAYTRRFVKPLLCE